MSPQRWRFVGNSIEKRSFVRAAFFYELAPKKAHKQCFCSLSVWAILEEVLLRWRCVGVVVMAVFGVGRW